MRDANKQANLVATMMHAETAVQAAKMPLVVVAINGEVGVRRTPVVWRLPLPSITVNSFIA